ncbi:hypothetical protein H257_09875 [Aphanomyces astaci]|uniref:HTH CENPB-type domain-containing protein n=1 Tax=Aphanomyces astaci TaxID=112090 RepID=W4GA24_APHAT|nr:hypothetical protein H257_09875 [Aphanomyces astaci]ETV75914.1 hypothetical protein H257_09875 [Aphanomyces astaci]|eukprot:XP_009834556.1 hypothetical protein H257_09875 [Aphanomyces astaci]
MAAKRNEVRAYKSLIERCLNFANRHGYKHRVPCPAKAFQGELLASQHECATVFQEKFGHQPRREKLPLLIIVKGTPGGDIERFEVPTYLPDPVYAVQEKAYMDQRVWSMYLREVLKPALDSPSVLLADNLKCHPLPANTTSVLQPLDVAIMGPFKQMCRTEWIKEDKDVTAQEKRMAMILREKLPLLIIVKGTPGGDIERFEVPTYLPDPVYAVQEKAYMDQRVWSMYLREVLKPALDSPSVLLADNLKCHPLPANTTSVLQPLDVAIMGPFKQMCRTEWIKEDKDVTAQEKRMAMILPAKAYDIPPCTLRKHVADTINGVNNDTLVTMGRVPHLPRQCEDDLVAWILAMERDGHRIGCHHIVQKATKISEAVHNVPRATKLSTGWYKRFLDRHRELRVSKAQVLSKPRNGVDQPAVKEFFRELSKSIALRNHLRPRMSPLSHVLPRTEPRNHHCLCSLVTESTEVCDSLSVPITSSEKAQAARHPKRLSSLDQSTNQSAISNGIVCTGLCPPSLDKMLYRLSLFKPSEIADNGVNETWQKRVDSVRDYVLLLPSTKKRKSATRKTLTVSGKFITADYHALLQTQPTANPKRKKRATRQAENSVEDCVI